MNLLGVKAFITDVNDTRKVILCLKKQFVTWLNDYT